MTNTTETHIQKLDAANRELFYALRSSTELLRAYQAAEVESGVVNQGLANQIAANDAALSDKK